MGKPPKRHMLKTEHQRQFGSRPLTSPMPDAQLAAYGVGIIALIGGIATVARGFRATFVAIGGNHA